MTLKQVNQGIRAFKKEEIQIRVSRLMKSSRGLHRSKAVAAPRTNISQRVGSLIKGEGAPRHSFNGKNRRRKKNRNGKVVAVVGGR